MSTARFNTWQNAAGTEEYFKCRAWVNFNGTGTVAIRAAGNVSSITDNGAGNYTVNFAVALPDANYAVLPSIQKDSGTGNETGPSVSTRTASGVVVVNSGFDGVSRDTSVFCVSVFR